MEEYGFCNSVFHQNLPSPSTDISGLTKITIDQSLDNATNTHSFVLNLLQNVSDPAEKNALIACENAYKIVEESFQTAAVNFVDKNYEAVADAERDTPRAQESCITSFGVPPNPPNPLVERNREMRILIAMSLVSARLLINGN
ncbi:putative Enzyme inhibitor [Melia azedarach]|uniref:Enzyme inhibitor n=1 Tax=Melia azedarach TaxID=155640 RepID=A0ACC1YE54_MELAZ|nr:putative Enzyme inhibitor [Melia azedarach]